VIAVQSDAAVPSPERGRLNNLAIISTIFALVSFWPVLLWYGQRLSDNSDEPLGVVALVTFVVLVWRSGRIQCAAPNFAATIFVLLYCLSIFFAPKLVNAALALAVIGIIASGGRIANLTLGHWTLLFLSLPLVASLNFYLGYPLRLIVCALASPLLNINGFSTAAQGTSLLWNNQTIEIDAPCSGVKMLWATLYLTATLINLSNIRGHRAALYAVVSVGAAAFLLLAILILFMANHFGDKENKVVRVSAPKTKIDIAHICFFPLAPWPRPCHFCGRSTKS